VILLYVRQFVEESAEEGGHLLVELLHLQLRDVLVGILDQFLTDLLLALLHTLQHLFVLALLVLVVFLVCLLVRILGSEVLPVHVL
jgi:hypothetical protein